MVFATHLPRGDFLACKANIMKLTSVLLMASVLAIGCNDPKQPKVEVNVKPPDTNISIEKSKTDTPAADVVPKAPQ